MNPLRFGIIGAGFGRRVHLPVVMALPEVEVAMLCASAGRNLAPLQQAHPGLRVTDRWQDVVADPAVDACVVAVPPAAQREIISALLQAGKHVLCEKPFGLTETDAAVMLAAARGSGRVHAVDFQFRFNPGLQGIKDIMASGALGRLERMDVLWLSGGRADPALPFSWQHDRAAGGGILNSYASHAFDYVEWLAGEPIVELHAWTDILIPQRPDSLGQLVLATAEDSCDCTARLASGAVVSLRISNCHRHGPGHRIEVFGSAGAVSFLQPQGDRAFGYALHVTEAGGRKPVSLAAPQAWDNHFQGVRAVTEAFVRQIRTGERGDAGDFQAGLRAQTLVQAALKSALERHAVNVPLPAN